jgi:hypothetical protein
MKAYTKYNNLDFESFSLDRILDTLDDSQGFILCTVFQKRYSLDINLKRHEDMKIWLNSQDLNFLVLDGIQKVIDPDTGKTLDYSILYILTIYNPAQSNPEEFKELSQMILKRYDLNSVITKFPNGKDLVSWNRDLDKKVFKNITASNMENLIKDFFTGLNKNKDKFYFLGIEKQASNLEVGPLIRKVPKKKASGKRAIA